MDIAVALTYITKDEAWLKKVLIGGLVLLIPFVGGLILYGFGVRIARNVIAGELNPLPEWDDIGGDLSRGFFVLLGGFIWGLPIWVLYVCTLILSSASDGAGIVALFINVCLIMPLSVILGIFIGPTLIGRFAQTDDFKSMLDFNAVFATIRSIGVGPYLLYLVLAIVAGFIATIGLIACFIGIFFTFAYAMMSQFHGAGQLARLAPGAPAGQIEASSHPAF